MENWKNDVLFWIKNAMTKNFITALDSYSNFSDSKYKLFRNIIDDSILAGIIFVESGKDIYKFIKDEQKEKPLTKSRVNYVCNNITTIDLNGSILYTFFKINENLMTAVEKANNLFIHEKDREYNKWKTGALAATKFVLKLLYEKFIYFYFSFDSEYLKEIKEQLNLKNKIEEVFLRLIIESYKYGHGYIYNKLIILAKNYFDQTKNFDNTLNILTNYDSNYSSKVISIAKEYKKLSDNVDDK